MNTIGMLDCILMPEVQGASFVLYCLRTRYDNRNLLGLKFSQKDPDIVPCTETTSKCEASAKDKLEEKNEYTNKIC